MELHPTSLKYIFLRYNCQEPIAGIRGYNMPQAGRSLPCLMRGYGIGCGRCCGHSGNRWKGDGPSWNNAA